VDERPSLGRRAIAGLVLIVVALVAIRILIGVISAVFWMVALVVLLVAAFWAVSTLKAGSRSRAEKRRHRDVKASRADAVSAPPGDDLVEAQMRQIKQQLREQGRL
jgi:uncharacterized protein (DUF58 family)